MLNNVDLMTSVSVVDGRSYERVSISILKWLPIPKKLRYAGMGRAASTLYIYVSQFPHASSPRDPSTRAATLYSNVLRSSASKRAHLWQDQRVRSSRLTR